MSALSIGAVAGQLGIRPSAIRYYEDEGLLTPVRGGGGRRAFDEPLVARLQVIHTARQLGFSLEEIRALLMDFPPDVPPPERWRALAREKLPEIDDQIRRALALKRMLQAGMRCECLRIEDCFLEDCSRPAAGRRALPIVSRGASAADSLGSQVPTTASRS
jgi:MerR family redox-sensitive transcriptional activator SoxR